MPLVRIVQQLKVYNNQVRPLPFIHTKLQGLNLFRPSPKTWTDGGLPTFLRV